MMHDLFDAVEAMTKAAEGLRPFIYHGCEYSTSIGASSPDSDYCTCRVNVAVRDANAALVKLQGLARIMIEPGKRNLAEFEKWADRVGYDLPSLKTAPRYDALQGWKAGWLACLDTQAEREKAAVAAAVREVAELSRCKCAPDCQATHFISRQEILDSITPDRQLALDRHDAETREKALKLAVQIIRKPRILDAMKGYVATTNFADEIVAELERALQEAEK